MRNAVVFIAVSVLFFVAACNKKDNGPLPVYNPDPYVNKYAGTYDGAYTAENNGVDSNGVFKIDTTYAYTLKVLDAGEHKITISHGPVNIYDIEVDSIGDFYFEDYNHNINGHFSTDSMFIYSDALNGYYDTIGFSGSWFVIQKLSFKGKKQL